MPLQIVVSNSLSNLAKKFAEDLKLSSNNVFQPYYIASQTVGMNNWLKLSLSENLGILANCRFVKPNDVVNQIYYLLGGDNKKIAGSEELQWIIYDLLEQKEFKESYKIVSEYYTNDPIKRMALAGKISDLFDQYQIYRYELINKWNADNLGTGNPDEIWQKWLWLKAKACLGDTFTDRVAVHEFILVQLRDKKAQEKIKEQFPLISFFGLSIITKFHIKLFEALAEYISISFYVLDPAPARVWLGNETEARIAKLSSGGKKEKLSAEGNVLLMEWGRVIKSTFHLFFESENKITRYSNSQFEKPEAKTLLGKIQSDIFNNADAKTRNKISKDDLRDGSLTINSCYTAVREVEVLYNYLSGLVDKSKETISTRDILVMVTDINKYAPYIKAVFDNAKYQFPYTIADQSFTAGDSLFTAVLQLFDLNNENFKSEAVLQLLDSGYIQKRFGIYDIALLRTAVNAANIRFGTEGREADDTRYVSFENGLKRIIYGICLKGEELFEIGADEIYPVELAEGSRAEQLIRFCHFIEVLIDFIKQRNELKTLKDWVVYTENLVEDLVYNSEDEQDSDFSDLLYHLGKLNNISESHPELISFDVFKHILSSRLSAETKAGAFAKGGITFCSMIPMRSIPYKIVGVLGLDFDKFPRKERPLGFDLMNKFKEPGDRDVKENDKHLFLETLLSAKEHLYISYIGRSTKNNSVIPPSALIDDLLDYMESGSKVEKMRDEFITLHPLHGFSKKYNAKDERLYSYLGEPENKEKPKGKGKPSGTDPVKEIKINELLNFFKSPFKYYYNKALGIFYSSEYDALADTEKFKVENGLEKWTLKNSLIHLEDRDIEAFRKKEVMTGGLPLKNTSVLELEAVKNEISALKEVFDDCRDGENAGFKNIDHPFVNYRLTGKLEGVYGDKLIVLSFSSSDYKDYRYVLQAYIKYLIAVNCGSDMEVHLLSQYKNTAFKAKKLSKPEAKRQLNYLISLFETGHLDIVPYFAEFQTKPSKITEYNADQLSAMISDAEVYDEYFNKEYNDGFFNNPDVLEKFLVNYKGIHESLVTVFPDFR